MAMERALGAEGAFVALNNRVSQSVPHLHIHVVPRRRKDGLRGLLLAAYEVPRRRRLQSMCAIGCGRRSPTSR